MGAGFAHGWHNFNLSSPRRHRDESPFLSPIEHHEICKRSTESRDHLLSWSVALRSPHAESSSEFLDGAMVFSIGDLSSREHNVTSITTSRRKSIVDSLNFITCTRAPKEREKGRERRERGIHVVILTPGNNAGGQLYSRRRRYFEALAPGPCHTGN